MELTEKLFNKIRSIGKEYDNTWEDFFTADYVDICHVCGNKVFAHKKLGVISHNIPSTVYLTICMECGAVINRKTWIGKD